MKWPSGSGKAAVEGKRGRDKLNERAEGEDGPRLLVRSPGPRPLDKGVAGMERKKKGRRGEEKGGRREKKDEEGGGEKRRLVEKEGRRGWKE